MKNFLVSTALASALLVASSITTPLASAAQDLGTNWRVYNGEPGTAKFWDINQPQALPGGLLQFPIQQFDTQTTGSFVIYLYNNYNFSLTADQTFRMAARWTPGTYETRSTICSGTPGYVRFEFQDVASGTYDSNDYWWSTGDNSLNLNAPPSTGSLAVALGDRSRWTNLCGQSATDPTVYPDCITGAAVADMSPYDGFTKAMKHVKQVGLAFGSMCRYASGVALDGGPGTFQLLSFTIAP